MKHLIIGCGPAALSAAATLRKADPAGSVTILSREKVRALCPDGAPLPARREDRGKGVLPRRRRRERSSSSARRPCGSIRGRREVVTAAGKRFAYDRLLIATGGTPERPKIEGGNLPFVFTVRDLPDVTGIRERLPGRAGRAVIAGAGPVGMEIGDALQGLGMAITFVVTSNRVFSTILDPPAAELVRRKIEEKGVEIRTGEDIVRIGEDGEVLLKSGEKRKCDIVILGKGVVPCLPFLTGSGIAAGRGIRVDDRQETNCPGVYAAGDVAETRDIVYEDNQGPCPLARGRGTGAGGRPEHGRDPGGLSGEPCPEHPQGLRALDPDGRPRPR